MDQMGRGGGVGLLIIGIIFSCESLIKDHNIISQSTKIIHKEDVMSFIDSKGQSQLMIAVRLSLCLSVHVRNAWLVIMGVLSVCLNRKKSFCVLLYIYNYFNINNFGELNAKHLDLFTLLHHSFITPALPRSLSTALTPAWSSWSFINL